MCYLVMICALVSMLALVGCGGDDDGGTVTSGQTIPSVNTGSVNLGPGNVQAVVGQPFPFPNGSIFDPSLGNNPATLTFTSANPPTFSLTSGGATSSGNATFGACTLNFTQGPLAPKSITFNPVLSRLLRVLLLWVVGLYLAHSRLPSAPILSPLMFR
jgi:hypothetical protein